MVNSMWSFLTRPRRYYIGSAQAESSIAGWLAFLAFAAIIIAALLHFFPNLH